jgi:hypothetical protein
MMMKDNAMKQHKTIMLRKSLLTSAMALALGFGLVNSEPAHALGFEFGDWSARLDTTITYGISMRTQGRDDDLVGFANLIDNPGAIPTLDLIDMPGRFSVNGDDGNLKFDQGDIISNRARVTTELDVSNGQFGAFARVTGFYDFELDDRDDISKRAKHFVGSDVRMLDAYLYGDFNVGDGIGSLRLGRQVVSWGESTFIQNGANVINPVDVAALREAGSELRNAFLPISMAWLSIPITQNLSMEAVYLFEFEEINPDPAGTFFSDNDFATPGGEFAMLGFGLLSDDILPDGSLPFGALPRSADRKPGDSTGQFGLAFRYFATELNDTEFGLFYLHYDSRLPLISGTTVTSSDLSSGRFFVEYPKGIDLYGLSFNTTLGGTISLAGEMTYRSNQPYQIDDVEVLFAGLSPLNAGIPEPANRFTSQLGSFGFGEDVNGVFRTEVSQLQFTLTNVFEPNKFFGYDLLAFVLEAGGTKVWDLPAQNVLRLNGPGTDTGGGSDQFTGNLRNPITQVNGFPDSFSWGYRAVLAATYNNAIGAVTISPRIAFNHDVNGTTPGPGGNFIEDRKAITVAVTADYLSRFSGTLSYTNFFGAKDFNLIHDRDFVSASVSYAF